MLYATVFAAVAALSGFASAQNSTCCTVPAASVPSSQKSAWCLAEKNTCPQVCGGFGQIATNGNTCDSSTLVYTCECKNGTKPEMDLYEQSVPGQMCRFWFDTCITASGTDRIAQEQCKTERDDKCGTLTADGEETTTTSTSASATASETAATSASSTDASMTAASTGGAATAVAIAREYGTPLFAGGMVALFGLAL